MEDVKVGDWISLKQGNTKSRWFVNGLEGNNIWVTHEDEINSRSTVAPQWLDVSMVKKVD